MTKLFSRLFSAVLCAGAVTSAFAAGVNLDETHASVRAVMAVQGKITGEFLRQLPEEILGTAVGLDAQGNPALVVYLNNTSANLATMRRAMPAAISGIPVVIEETEPFRAFGKPGGGGGKPGGGGGTVMSHTAKQTPPIQLGTSGGWQMDSANGYCCGGTLGSLISVFRFCWK
jgi:hypothetical protein